MENYIFKVFGNDIHIFNIRIYPSDRSFEYPSHKLRTKDIHEILKMLFTDIVTIKKYFDKENVNFEVSFITEINKPIENGYTVEYIENKNTVTFENDYDRIAFEFLNWIKEINIQLSSKY